MVKGCKANAAFYIIALLFFMTFLFNSKETSKDRPPYFY